MLFRNTAFQLMGRGSALLAGLISVPVYFQYLGAEAYGVIGVFVSLMALSGLFDLGLPVQINRKISIMRAKNAKSVDVSSLIRAFEFIFLLLCAGIYLVIYFVAPFIADIWLNLVKLNPYDVKNALELAGLAVVLRFPAAFYSNCLYAFDAHGRSNAISTVASICRVVFAITGFEMFGAKLEVFFWSQILVNALEVISLAITVWLVTKHPLISPASKSTLKDSLHMTVPLTGLSITALLLSQVDKIILSKLVELDVFGVYSLAYSLAMGILPIAYAIGNASFPTINRYIADQNIKGFEDIVRKILQTKVLVLFPVVALFVFCSDQLTNLALMVSHEAVLALDYLSILILGAFFQCFTVLTYGVRLAQGKAKGLFLLSLSGLLIFSGMYFTIFNSFGIYGICGTFIACNLYILLGQICLNIQEKEYKELWVRELSFHAVILILSFLLIYLIHSCLIFYNYVMSINVIIILSLLFITSIGQFFIFKKYRKKTE